MKVDRGLAQFGEYTLIRELGRGASASAYLAQSLKSPNASERVCLKIFHSSFFKNDQALRRVNREFEISAGLHHPNIISIRSILRTEPPALVMDYVDGENLETFQNKLPYILPEVSALIVIEILKALEYAHEKGVIHRDLKPENVIVEKSGRIFVTDFGLAKFEDSKTNITQPHAIVGSADYMAPEQVSGEVLTSRADLFSVGSIFYFLSTGTRPFSRSSAMATLNSIQHDNIEAPDRRNPKISADLSRILQKALNKDPWSRYQTAGEFRSALENYLRGLGLGPGTASFSKWLAEPADFTVFMLRATVENLSLSAESAAMAKDWAKSMEILAHLSLKAPESPVIDRVTKRMPQRRPFKAAWFSVAAALVIALIFFGYRSYPVKQTTVATHSEVSATTPTVAPKVIPPPPPPLSEVQFKVPEEVEVYWDGVRVTSNKLKAKHGKHQLVLRRDNYAPIEQQIVVTAKGPVVIGAE